MKKVVCAQCGLVNLEKFVSYPHCAACGARLPQEKPSRWRTLWKRPVKPLYWMLAVGASLSVLGAAIASLALETSARGGKPLLVYAQLPRQIAAGQSVSAQFALDSAEENPDATFNGVSLRLGRETRALWQVVALRPAPTSSGRQGSGFYYYWDALPRNGSLVLTLRARGQTSQTSGALPFRVTLAAQNYAPFEVRTSVGARAAAVAPMQKPANVAR